MPDRATFLPLLHDLAYLAQEARQRGDERRPGDLPPHYWYDMAFGYEDAIDRLKAVLDDRNKV